MNNPGNYNGNELVLVNIGDYQSAQALSEEAIKIFERKLRPQTQGDTGDSNSGIASVSKVEGSLAELNSLLNNKALPEDLMKIVHTHKFIPVYNWPII